MFCVFIDVLDCLRGMVLVHSMFREYCTRGVMHFLIIEQHRFLKGYGSCHRMLHKLK